MIRRRFSLMTALIIFLGIIGVFSARKPSSEEIRYDQNSPIVSTPISQKEIHYPLAIENCLEKNRLEGKLVVDSSQNPYYLRGDFDGNGQPDYAIAIQGKVTKRNGVLICFDTGRAVILGADNPKNPPFSDMPDDNFVSPDWEVYTRTESYDLLGHSGNQRKLIKGETVAMVWEDGICLIYWDGRKFNWGCHGCDDC